LKIGVFVMDIFGDMTWTFMLFGFSLLKSNENRDNAPINYVSLLEIAHHQHDHA
jgi:hypothetical protein